jgi:hypothetical protein
VTYVTDFHRVVRRRTISGGTVLHTGWQDRAVTFRRACSNHCAPAPSLARELVMVRSWRAGPFHCPVVAIRVGTHGYPATVQWVTAVVVGLRMAGIGNHRRLFGCDETRGACHVARGARPLADCTPGSTLLEAGMRSSRFRSIDRLATTNQMAGGKLAMIAGPHPPAL